MILPVHSMSLGSSPRSISSPNRLHKIRRKYSWRGKERKLRESVSIPINRLIKPILESVFSCLVIPSFWSKNHQALPHCILPATEPSLKLPIMVAISSLSAGLRLYKMVFASLFPSSSLSKNVDKALPCGKSPMESQPVSAPSWFSSRAIIVAQGTQVILLHPSFLPVPYRQTAAAWQLLNLYCSGVISFCHCEVVQTGN